ncbi:AAA family ATPase [Nocardioides rubriscoriae]|uniref:bifunctional aminoglycoside phosphotransferase/ATP-binding protein n=1 Tax=Nocardioides rubriscoriae TaxID=642762 RepID=UPI0011DF4254|nr:bifunctional aminoglycoside phosphotransferase/ATP-binding protein [Nocardioides rubriscoriae]
MPRPPDPPGAPRLELTHSGLVLLTDDTAYKFKRPVRLAFLDFTDLQARRDACQRELELNRRLAPDVYLGVGTLGLPGPQAEPCLVMRRLPDDRRLTHLLTATPAPATTRPTVEDALTGVARTVAAFHAGARRGPDVDPDGGRNALAARWRANLTELGAAVDPARGPAGSTLDPLVVEEVEVLVEEFLAGREPLLAARVADRRIVDGHGDLLAQDIFCLDDGPRILDCLDFDDRLRHLDVLDDLACLVADVERLAGPDQAAVLLERYRELSGDPAPPSLVHHYMAYRAFMRAKVACLAGAARDVHHGHLSTPQELADLARHHLRVGRVRLVLCGGAPGTGKTTVAGEVADRLGWVVLSSDRVRKELAGLDPEDRSPQPYRSGFYDDACTARTYETLLHRAEVLLGRGESVVLDASWTSASWRRRAASVAGSCHVPLTELRCAVEPAVAERRIDEREGDHGARSSSDATVAVARRMRLEADPWPTAVRVDTGGEVAQTVDRLVADLGWQDVVAARRPRSRMAPD